MPERARIHEANSCRCEAWVHSDRRLRLYPRGTPGGTSSRHHHDLSSALRECKPLRGTWKAGHYSAREFHGSGVRSYAEWNPSREATYAISIPDGDWRSERIRGCIRGMQATPGESESSTAAQAPGYARRDGRNLPCSGRE